MSFPRILDFRTLAMAVTLVVPTAAQAQDIVMRRPIPRVSVPTPAQVNTWHTAPWALYDGAVQVDPNLACGVLTERRDVTCRASNGTTVADGACAGVAKPESMRSGQRHDAGCRYAWVTGVFVDPGPSCTTAETQGRNVSCHNVATNEVVDDQRCGSPPPNATQVIEDFSACSYSAVNPKAWTPSSTCSADATKTRTMECRRSDGVIVPGEQCTSRGVALNETVAEPNLSNCAMSWDPGAFVDPGASCGNETWTRTVSCRRDLDHVAVDDALCPAANRPASTEARYDVSACGYTARNWSDWTFDSTCSATAKRTRHAQCVRSDGEVVGDDECIRRDIAVSETVTEPNHSSCSNVWKASGYVDPGASCTATETQIRTVQCRREIDDVVVSDASCNAAERPGTSRQVEDYSGCGYTPTATQSSCTNGQQTVANGCRRSDGLSVSPSLCGLPETSVQSCTSYGWQTGAFGPWNACIPAGTQSRTRDVRCEMANGNAHSTVDETLCTENRPGGSEQRACSTYAWTFAGTTDWNDTCSASATRTHEYYCRREQDNASVIAGNCTAANPSHDETQAVWSGCSYTPTNGAWSQCADGSQARTNTCRRDRTGQDVDPAVYCGTPAGETRACTGAVAGIGFRFIPIPGQSRWNWNQEVGSVRSLAADQQKPRAACVSLGYTSLEQDDFTVPGDHPENLGSNTCYEYLDGASTGTVWDGAGFDRTYYWRKP